MLFLFCVSTVSYVYSIEQFKNKIKAKNYNFEIKDVEEDFLPTTRKRMIIGKEALDIYLVTIKKWRMK